MLKGILDYAHYLLKESVELGETVIDATCGNGNDTLFLSDLVGGEGHVLAFDIQEQAISATKQKAADLGKTNITLIRDSHANAADYIMREIGGAIFNLGYLPKSDKAIITKAESTITALEAILSYLKKDGLIVIVVYHGHEGGKTEKEAVLNYVTQLEQKEYHVMRYEFINQKNNPPFLLAVQNRK
ncbi:rRNA methyltransferase [Virgibacillus indicus]|uniref:rRNA methyltransferase n=1 Tax=Virgibacillus indicus TaxID=2024554 RepID=A0A265N948_9BACI|nr:class I SAM-dependent methyltransferase [Virgibacillus indicus]OZU88523.1 rRNA methyltransferase [Virgibacillus indicus]